MAQKGGFLMENEEKLMLRGVLIAKEIEVLKVKKLEPYEIVPYLKRKGFNVYDMESIADGLRIDRYFDRYDIVMEAITSFKCNTIVAFKRIVAEGKEHEFLQNLLDEDLTDLLLIFSTYRKSLKSVDMGVYKELIFGEANRRAIERRNQIIKDNTL